MKLLAAVAPMLLLLGCGSSTTTSSATSSANTSTGGSGSVGGSSGASTTTASSSTATATSTASSSSSAGSTSGTASTNSGSSSASSSSSSGGSTSSSSSATGSTGATTTTGGDICSTQACVVYAHTDSDLYKVDPLNPQAASHICTFGGDIANAGDLITDIAVDVNGVVYAISFSQLYSVDALPPPGTSACDSTYVATVNGSSTYNALTFTIDGGLLAANQDGTIASVDTATGNTAQVGSFTNGYGASGDFVALADGRIFATAIFTGPSDILVQIEQTAPGAYNQTAVIGPIADANTPYSQIYGLGFWAGTLYGFDALGNVITIDPTTATATLLGNNGVQWYGAGTTPKAPLQK